MSKRQWSEPKATEAPRLPDCSCAACKPNGWHNGYIRSRMIVCATCGNKRCPHATNHVFVCTGSNEPGQPGSRYE